ncbi:uncharacterized protein TRUGW13939_10384 [Talaromyces rugulosus]|uniref:Major facilitator superfamily (MFS) profile domain-containing protein n=1 Tax=Talaromyces rugulosus TaxID=121627 RepID=A0A7H8RCI3_TALRU|nr:uncharacterized protein TRUGW13939_10384 [Talaromyces rugulosus]QKX63215.1 hypothetical protein TRUGW13939_10384 [Talaromyces rugulosus]
MNHLYESVTSSEPQNDKVLGEEIKRPLRKGELFCLAISMGSLQVTWVTIMAEGSPFLLSLGLVPSLVSLVWLAGPVCGTLLQPFIGYKSDTCTHRWGRRKPYIIYGTLVAFDNQIASNFLGLGMNISLQPVQAGLRELTVDHYPDRQQAEAGTFTSCIILIGSLIGYGAGFPKIPIPSVHGLIENIQFKGLCLIAFLSLGNDSRLASVPGSLQNSSRSSSNSEDGLSCPVLLLASLVSFFVLRRDIPEQTLSVELIPDVAFSINHKSTIDKSNILLIKNGASFQPVLQRTA